MPHIEMPSVVEFDEEVSVALDLRPRQGKSLSLKLLDSILYRCFWTAFDDSKGQGHSVAPPLKLTRQSAMPRLLPLPIRFVLFHLLQHGFVVRAIEVLEVVTLPLFYVLLKAHTALAKGAAQLFGCLDRP